MSDGEYIGSESAGSNSNTHTGMGRVAVRGSAMVVLSQAFAKVGGLASLWVLGYYLTQEQFGLWGLALSVVYLVDCVRDLGAQKVLIQRGAEYNEICSPVFRMGLAFNFLGALLLLVMAPVMSSVYGDQRIGWLIVIAAFSIPLQTPTTVLRAKLSIDLKFKALAVLQVCSQLLKSGSMVLFAVIGFGSYSFVWPLILVAIFNIAAFRWVAGPMPPKHPDAHTHYRSLFSAVKWIAFGAVAAAVINQCDRLVIGWFTDKATVGIYFFGFQLVLSGLQVFGVGVMSVFMPTLTKLAGDPQRLARAFQRLVRVSMMLMAPVCVCATIASRPVIELLWGGSWDVAIPVVQIMSLSMSLFILGPVSLSVIEATGRWRLRAAVMSLNMVTVLAAAAAGSILGGLITITLWIAAQKVVLYVVQCLIASRIVKISIVSQAVSIFSPVLLAGVCGGGSYLLFKQVIPIESVLLHACASITLFAMLYGACVFLLMRQLFNEVVGMLGHLRPGQG